MFVAKTIRSMEEKMNDDVTHENVVDDLDEYNTEGNVGSGNLWTNFENAHSV